MSRKIYVASSWRNNLQNEVVKRLREAGHEVYDFKNPPHNSGFAWSSIDPDWLNWTSKEFIAALETETAQKGFNSDFTGMTQSDVCILVLPCGRSAHSEAGFMAGQGKTVIVLTNDEQEPELMYKLYSQVTDSLDEVVDILTIPEGKSVLKPKNNQIYLDFGGTDKIMQGSFTCKQCAIGQVMNTNCIFILNSIGNSVQCCDNCGYDNYFDVRGIIKTNTNEED